MGKRLQADENRLQRVRLVRTKKDDPLSRVVRCTLSQVAIVMYDFQALADRRRRASRAILAMPISPIDVGSGTGVNATPRNAVLLEADASSAGRR